VNTRRPLAQYTVAPIKAFAPWNRTTYEGISSHVEKRFSSALSFIASVTYGRALDLQNPALDACDGCGAGDTVQNSDNRNAQKGPSDNNVPLRFAFGGVWDLPFGPGRALFRQGWAAHVLGLWELSGIYQVQSGLPYTVRLSFDNANAGTISYPNRVCNGTLSHPTLSQWFDTNCFVAPQAYQFGNEGRNVLTGPGRNNLDLGLHRSFRIPPHEPARLEFRGEAYNLFNHPQFANPGDTIGNPGVGVISSTSVANRILQIALRLVF
jgi:hypothetical protein